MQEDISKSCPVQIRAKILWVWDRFSVAKVKDWKHNNLKLKTRTFKVSCRLVDITARIGGLFLYFILCELSRPYDCIVEFDNKNGISCKSGMLWNVPKCGYNL